MPYRRYNILLATVLVPVVALLTATGAGLQPYAGDLTRLGGYSERQYGWNDPQQRFAPPLYRLGTTARPEYPPDTDILILGDSFTINTAVSWPNYLVQQTGLRVHAIRHDWVTLDVTLASRAFRDAPPPVLIYQIVERNLIGLRGPAKSRCAVQPAPAPVPMRARPLDVTTALHHRRLKRKLIDFSLAIDYLGKNAPRAILKQNRTETVQVGLSREAPLSNRERRSLLVYKGDLLKPAWTPQDWEGIRCGLIDMQNRVQANGKTVFIAMIAPDKLTGYGDLLDDRRYAVASRIDLLATDPKLHLPRIDRRLKQAIADGVVDVYLGNDTHWGSAGHELAGKEVVAFLARSGVLRGAPR